MWVKSLSLRKSDTEFFRLFFQLEFRCHIGERTRMYVWMDGVNSDNALSIQTMVTRTMVTQKMVGQKMFSRNMVPLNMVCRNLVTLNMVTPKLLGTRLHRTGCSTLVISWHLEFFFSTFFWLLFFLFFFIFYFLEFLFFEFFVIITTTSITYFTLLNPMAMYIGNGHIFVLLFFSCANIFW